MMSRERRTENEQLILRSRFSVLRSSFLRFSKRGLSVRFHLCLPNAFSLVVILLFSALYFGVFGDLDWSWQVRMGEWIVQSGSLRPPDSFSYTIDGTVPHDFEWLYEVMLW